MQNQQELFIRFDAFRKYSLAHTSSKELHEAMNALDEFFGQFGGKGSGPNPISEIEQNLTEEEVQEFRLALDDFLKRYGY